MSWYSASDNFNVLVNTFISVIDTTKNVLKDCTFTDMTEIKTEK